MTAYTGMCKELPGHANNLIHQCHCACYNNTHVLQLHTVASATAAPMAGAGPPCLVVGFYDLMDIMQLHNNDGDVACM